MKAQWLSFTIRVRRGRIRDGGFAAHNQRDDAPAILADCQMRFDLLSLTAAAQAFEVNSQQFRFGTIIRHIVTSSSKTWPAQTCFGNCQVGHSLT